MKGLGGKGLWLATGGAVEKERGRGEGGYSRVYGSGGARGRGGKRKGGVGGGGRGRGSGGEGGGVGGGGVGKGGGGKVRESKGWMGKVRGESGKWVVGRCGNTGWERGEEGGEVWGG